MKTSNTPRLEKAVDGSSAPVAASLPTYMTLELIEQLYGAQIKEFLKSAGELFGIAIAGDDIGCILIPSATATWHAIAEYNLSKFYLTVIVRECSLSSSKIRWYERVCGEPRINTQGFTITFEISVSKGTRAPTPFSVFSIKSSRNRSVGIIAADDHWAFKDRLQWLLECDIDTYIRTRREIATAMGET